MVPNNNLSVLPFYTNIQQQNARKWWVNGKVYPLFTPAGFLLPFQIQMPITEDMQLLAFDLYNRDGELIASLKQGVTEMGITQVKFNDYSVVVFPGKLPVLPQLDNGQYYIHCRIDTDTQGEYEYFSEIFTVVNDISGYLKLEWWDIEDFVTDAGTIVYKYAGNAQFRNVLYLCADIAKPEYVFNEEIIERDGYTFPVKQVSEKQYRFSFFASEYLLDVLRFVRMADYARITKDGQTYMNLDTFLITPEWEDNGDVAAVDAEFTTDTVAKKIGRGWIRGDNGDFNDDFNDDFDNITND